MGSLKIPLMFALLAIQACGPSGFSTRLASHAVPNDRSTFIGKIVVSGSPIRYALVSKGRAYEIDCPAEKRNAFFQAVGYTRSVVDKIEDSDLIAQVEHVENPKLACANSNDKTLYRSVLNGQTRYFFSDTLFGNQRLYTMGCPGLIKIQGFNIAQAIPIDSKLISTPEKPAALTADDSDDINCIKGSGGSSLVFDGPFQRSISRTGVVDSSGWDRHAYIMRMADFAVLNSSTLSWTTTDLSRDYPIGSLSSLFSLGKDIFLTADDAAGGVLSHLLISSDYGLSWEKRSEIPQTKIRDLLVSDGTIFAVGDGGLARSTDGSSWELTRNTGLQRVFIDQDKVYLGGTKLFVSEQKGAMGSFKTISVYDSVGSFYANTFTAIHTLGSVLYLGTKDFGLYVSGDAGKTWINRSERDGLGSKTVKDLLVIGDTLLVINGNGDVLLSFDDGQSFSIIEEIKNASRIDRRIDTLYITAREGVFTAHVLPQDR